jgi:hypothetical protein
MGGWVLNDFLAGGEGFIFFMFRELKNPETLM